MVRVCGLTLFPVRSEASHRSEMVTQLLYGESYEVIDKDGEWNQIRILEDGYKGWIDGLPKSAVTMANRELCTDLFFKSKDGLVPMGGFVDASFEEPTDIIQTAKKWLNAPYLWGGKTAFGVDCSGFVQVVHKVHEIWLPRDASEQVKIGEEVQWGDRRIGDLAYFENEKGAITHVGILCERDKIIHASKWVRVDRLTEKGIFLEDSTQTHTLNCLKRLR